MDVSSSLVTRKVTKQIAVGDVKVGGDAPITVQSMTITKTADVEGTLQQIYALAAAGADIVRCTCNEEPAAEGLAQIDDESQIVTLIAGVLARNADAVQQYRGGKQTTFGFLVGQVMKAAGGKANPKRVNELLKKSLDVL